MMVDQVYTSRIRLERVKGPLRHAYIHPFAQPVRFGVHALDYMIAAVGG